MIKNNQKNKSLGDQSVPSVELWWPTWRWHLKSLAGIYLFLAVFYFAMDHWLSHLPQPYRLRDVPMEMTPWLKK